MHRTNSRVALKFKAIIFAALVPIVSLVVFFVSTYYGQAQIAISGKPSLTKTLFSKGEALYQKQCMSCHGAFGA